MRYKNSPMKPLQKTNKAKMSADLEIVEAAEQEENEKIRTMKCLCREYFQSRA